MLIVSLAIISQNSSNQNKYCNATVQRHFLWSVAYTFFIWVKQNIVNKLDSKNYVPFFIFDHNNFLNQTELIYYENLLLLIHIVVFFIKFLSMAYRMMTSRCCSM